jgi:ABC-type nitrate/sulfonate/bicarbonate transport system permease component
MGTLPKMPRLRTALLPMRRQYVPGIGLLLLAPVLIIWIGLDYGWLVAVLAVAAFVSMFRNLLHYICRRLKGEHPEIPQ